MKILNKLKVLFIFFCLKIFTFRRDKFLASFHFLLVRRELRVLVALITPKSTKSSNLIFLELLKNHNKIMLTFLRLYLSFFRKSTVKSETILFYTMILNNYSFIAIYAKNLITLLWIVQPLMWLSLKTY